MRIVMTLIVRDEADVLEQNLRVHRALGVDRFVVLDNGSEDASVEVLDRWSDAGVATVISEPDAKPDEIFRSWPTRLARLALEELDADWVVPNDADEFWWPLEGTLRDVFAAVPDDAQAILAPRFEFVPRPGERPWWERLLERERTTTVRPKVACRASADLEIGPGAHHVASPSLGLEPAAGRPSLRGFRRRPEQPRLLVPAAAFPLAIWHLPLRSLAQYRRRLEIGLRLAGSTAPEALGDRVTATLEGDGVEERWRELAVDDATAAERVAAGTLRRETRLRDLIAGVEGRAPGEIEPGSATVPAPEPGERSALHAEIAREAIRGLIHNEVHALTRARRLWTGLGRTKRQLGRARGQLSRRRERLAAERRRLRQTRRELRRTGHDLRRARKRLRRLQGHLWWRLRPRLPRRKR